MAEENVLPSTGDSQPEKPSPQPSPSAELPPESPAPAENGQDGQSKNPVGRVFRKITGKLTGLAARRGLEFRKGKGRPKKCRECNGDGCDSCNFTGIVPGKADSVDGEPAKAVPVVDVPQAPVVPAAAVVPVPAEAGNPAHRSLLHRSIVSGVKGILGGLDSYCRSLARRAGMPAEEVRETFDKAKPEPQALDDLSESLGVVLEKHNVNTEHAPEISLAILAGKIAAPYAIAIFEIRAFIKRQEARGTA